MSSSNQNEFSLTRYVGGMVSTNGYLCNTGSEYIAIDAPKGFYDVIQSRGVRPAALLLTHQHYDHVEDAHLFAAAGIPIYAYAPYDPDLILATLAQRWGMDITVEPYTVTNILKGESLVKIGNTSIGLMHVPGHSTDSVVFYLAGKHVLFAGDTLFQGSVGRSDLPGGDEALLLNGIAQKMLTLNVDIEVFPGHGDPTNVGVERQTNRFFCHLDIRTEGTIK